MLPADTQRVSLRLNAGATSNLAEELATDTMVTHLTLVGKCGDKGAEALGAALKHNSSLRSLVLPVNNIKLKGCLGLAAGIQANHRLQLLDLGGNQITDQGGVALANALTANHSLVSLGLQMCGLGENTAVALAAMLKQNTTLEQLQLGRLATRSTGMLALAGAIQVNSTLKYLHFHDLVVDSTVKEGASDAVKSYAVSTEALQGFAEALSSNTGLKKLEFFACTLGDEAHQGFAGALESNTTLCAFHPGEALTSRSCAAYGAALDKNTTLYKLRICGQGLTDDDTSPIVKGCQRNLETVLAAQKAGECPPIDNHINFNWMFAFPLLKSHLALECAEPVKPSAKKSAAKKSAARDKDVKEPATKKPRAAAKKSAARDKDVEGPAAKKPRAAAKKSAKK